MSRRFVTVFAGVLAWGLPASAEPLERGALRLEWSAPGGCPNAVEVAMRIEALLGARITDMTPEPIAARGKVTELGPLRYALELETRQRDQRFVRSMQAPSCAELSDAGALVLALAIDPTLAERRARAGQTSPAETGALGTEQPPPAAAEAAPVPTTAPPPPASEPAPAPTTTPSPKPRRAITTLDTEDPTDEEPVVLPPRVSRWSFRLGLLLDAGTVAEGAYGFNVGFGVPFDAFRAEVAITYLPPARTVIAEAPERGGDIDLFATDLAGCWVPIRDEHEIGVCGLLELGILRGAGFGTSLDDEGSTAWVALGPRGFGRLKAAESLFVTASLEVLFPLERPEFTLENVGTVHRVSPVVPRAGLAVEAEFY